MVTIKKLHLDVYPCDVEVHRHALPGRIPEVGGTVLQGPEGLQGAVVGDTWAVTSHGCRDDHAGVHSGHVGLLMS